MSAAAIVMIILMAAEIGHAAALDGQPKEGIHSRHSFWITLLSMAILAGIMAWGGFFARGAA